MPYRKRQFANNKIYHLMLRGIDDHLIFKDEDDYDRGIFSIYEFNNERPIKIRERRRIKKLKTRTGPTCMIDDREKLVEVLAFCFMPDHFHLLVKQLKDGGITKFMRKVGTGYGGYFNRKYGRTGYVFQNRFSSVIVEDELQLKIVFVYILTNPAALLENAWKEKGVNNRREITKFLEKYRWSSYSEYLSRKNVPAVTDRDFILKAMQGGPGCKKAVISWIKYNTETSKFAELDKLALEKI